MFCSFLILYGAIPGAFLMIPACISDDSGCISDDSGLKFIIDSHTIAIIAYRGRIGY